FRAAGSANALVAAPRELPTGRRRRWFRRVLRRRRPADVDQLVDREIEVVREVVVDARFHQEVRRCDDVPVRNGRAANDGARRVQANVAGVVGAGAEGVIDLDRGGDGTGELRLDRVAVDRV